MTPAERTVALTNRHPRLQVCRRMARAFRCSRSTPTASTCPPPSGRRQCPSSSSRTGAGADPRRLPRRPTTADVITFAGDPPPAVPADARRPTPPPALWGCRPAPAGRPAGGVRRRLTLYLVHGWLHLGGYDDLQPATSAVRAAEQRALTVLRPPRHPRLPPRVAAAGKNLWASPANMVHCALVPAPIRFTPCATPS